MFSRKTLLRPVQPDSSGLWRTITRFVPIGIALVGIVAGVMVFLSHERALVQLKERVHEENQIRMHSTLEHVQDYFDSVHSTLLFVSLDESVKAMRKDSRGFIQRLYDHQWEHHRLSEVYIVERDFPGTRRPFQTFERGWEDQPADELHTLTRELEEYQTQRRHVGQFLAHTHLPALISSEVMLCVNDPEGQRARGLVYSVPIYSTNGLAGIVAGMIPTHILQQILKRDQYQQVALLINSRGEIYGGQESHAPLRSWFEEQFNQQEASQFFARGARAFAIDRFNALWNPVKVVSAEKWWLVYLYDREAHLQRSSFAGRSGHAALAGMIVAVGVVLGLMAHLTAERLEDKVRHLRDRTQLERQVQAASEREQRRIGENLHEDLCQRLAGAEAAGGLLEAQLKKRGLAEAGLAGGITEELRESLKQARQYADLLQPVSLLEQGLLAAVERLTLHAQRRSDAKCCFEGEDLPDLDADVATHLYRIAQEALNNALQHAQAKKLDICLSATDRQVTLLITDDGVGMPKGADQSAGIGLRLMRYRSDVINAKLEIQSTPGKGTKISCVCPPYSKAESASSIR